MDKVEKTAVGARGNDYLKSFIQQKEMYEEAKLRILKRISQEPLFVGAKRWSREEIYER